MSVKDSKASKPAFLGLLAALSLAVLFLAGVSPTGRLSLTALSGLAVAAAVLKTGLGGGFLCWAAVSILGVALLPSKSCAALYAVFFGLYPAIKSLIERLGRLWLEWALKLLFFLAAMTLCVLALKGLFSEEVFAAAFDKLALAYPVGCAAFVLYDLAFTGLIRIYLIRVPGARG